MGSEPGVDAGEVESVGALGEDLDDLPVHELAEADGAVSAVHEAVAGLVNGGGDGFDDGLVNADGPDEPDVVRGIIIIIVFKRDTCLLYTSPSPRDS